MANWAICGFYNPDRQGSCSLLSVFVGFSHLHEKLSGNIIFDFFLKLRKKRLEDGAMVMLNTTKPVIWSTIKNQSSNSSSLFNAILITASL